MDLTLIATVIVIVVLWNFRKSITAWSNVAEGKSLDIAQRAGADSLKYNAKTVDKLDALEDHYSADDVAKYSKALSKQSLKKKLDALVQANSN